MATRGRNLDVALFDLLLENLQPAVDLGTLLPGRDARIEDIVHLLQGEALGLLGSQEHVDKGGSVD